VEIGVSTSGHIMGILSPPIDPPKRRFRATDATGCIDPELWLTRTDKVSGSWWTDWVNWLRPLCGVARTPPRLRNESYPRLAPAPGDYVMER
jgi:polyhydroxyalkanoate synthase